MVARKAEDIQTVQGTEISQGSPQLSKTFSRSQLRSRQQKEPSRHDDSKERAEKSF